VASSEDAGRRLGIVGAGKIGTTIARAAIAGGYEVAISGSGPAERIALIVDVLAPGAQALSTDEVVRSADLIVLAVPMQRFRDLSHDLFAGKILVDAMNYWEEIDGLQTEIATAPAGTSVLVQEWFSSARVVKSLNHLGYFKFEKSRLPRGTPGRLAMAAAGDDRAAVAAVLELIDRLGFDAVDAGGLQAGFALEPGGPVFGVGRSAEELSKLLSGQKRRARMSRTEPRLRPVGERPSPGTLGKDRDELHDHDVWGPGRNPGEPDPGVDHEHARVHDEA
jgi:predicted dinucleotide-binding enzyme